MATIHSRIAHSAREGGSEAVSGVELKPSINPGEFKSALTALAGDALKALGIGTGLSVAVIAGGTYWLSKVEMFATPLTTDQNMANGVAAMLGIIK